MDDVVQSDSVERNGIQHLRIILESDNKEKWDLSDSFFHNHAHEIRNFPSLTSCDVLVIDGLIQWTKLIEEKYWGNCPTKNVRVLDAKTGEWIDQDTGGPWQNWLNSSRGTDREGYTRIMPEVWWEEVDENDPRYERERCEELDGDERWEKLMRLKDRVPRMDVGC